METKKVSLRLPLGRWDFENDKMFKKYVHLISEVVDEGPSQGIFDKDYPNDWWCYLKDGYEWDGQTIIHEPTRRMVIDCLKQVRSVDSWTDVEIPKNWPKKCKEIMASLDKSATGAFKFTLKGFGDEFRADTIAQVLRTAKEFVEIGELIEEGVC